MTLREVLVREIEQSGKSANALAKELDLPQTTITRFLLGTDMRLSAAEKIAAYFGLELRPAEPKKPVKRKNALND